MYYLKKTWDMGCLGRAVTALNTPYLTLLKSYIWIRKELFGGSHD